MEANPSAACPKCGQAIAIREETVGGPINCPHCNTTVTVVREGSVPAGMSAREAYNLVTDLGGGVNVRWKDNVLQLAAILIAMVLGAAIGAFVVDEPVAGALVGGFGGVLVGLFGSGIFLMIYRFICHARGHHK